MGEWADGGQTAPFPPTPPSHTQKLWQKIQIFQSPKSVKIREQCPRNAGNRLSGTQKKNPKICLIEFFEKRELKKKDITSAFILDLKAPSPEVPCEDTVLGCCWDGKTRKMGLSNEGCPDCKDSEEFAGLCIRWRQYCHRGSKTYRDIMEKFCLRTCGKCQGRFKELLRMIT